MDDGLMVSRICFSYLIDNAEHLLQEQETLLSGAAFAADLDANRGGLVGRVAAGEFGDGLGNALERQSRRAVALVQFGLLAANRFLAAASPLPL